ncbi:MAG: nicotinamide-nucleotide amidohydrolase family protein, partial [Sphaerospermopsis kisseleviana]
SDYFWGGVISYDNTVKVRLLGVNPDDLDQFGAVSATVAEQMAIGVKNLLQTTWGLSITGIAGPSGGTATKPVGLVYIGMAGPGNEVTSYECKFGTMKNRSFIRLLSACTALDNLRRSVIVRTSV